MVILKQTKQEVLMKYTFAEQLESDTYTVRFFDDKNNDYVPDPKGVEFVLKYPVPCKK